MSTLEKQLEARPNQQQVIPTNQADRSEHPQGLPRIGSTPPKSQRTRAQHAKERG